MSCLWGLPISGDPVTGTTDTTRIQGRLYDLLGIQDNEIKRFMKKLGKDDRTSDLLLAKKALRERFRILPTGASEIEKRWLVFFSI